MAKGGPAEAQLDLFIGRYTPEIAGRARAVLGKMRQRLPGATQMVYDNYNALVIGFGETDKVSSAPFSIALYPRWVTLFFLQGAGLPDPSGILKGNGREVRHVVLHEAGDLDLPDVEELIRVALDRAGWVPAAGAPCSLVVKSVSPNQRPRTPRPSVSPYGKQSRSTRVK